MSPRFTDPRCDELDEMLAGLSPRRELAYRLALMGLSEHCRGDAKWKRRIAELEGQTGRDGIDFTEILRDAETLQSEIIRATARKKRRLH